MILQYMLLLRGIEIVGGGLETVEKPNKQEAELIALISKTITAMNYVNEKLKIDMRSELFVRHIEC